MKVKNPCNAPEGLVLIINGKFTNFTARKEMRIAA